MYKYRLGIDIDGTITDPATFIPHLNKHFKKNLTLNDIVDYDLTTVLEISSKEFTEWMSIHEPFMYQHAQMAVHAKNILTEWKKRYELYYISARPKHVHELTVDWFHRLTIPYDHIELLGQHDKLNAVKRHKVDVFFEDKHDNACNIAEECNIPVILIDTPYNQLAVPSNVHRVQHWNEAKIIVDNLFR
ncbi:5' nucleotidase, NT5C type [Salipaludibacillus sp. HK11]|uniref:5' nucleotidase, NT5C type n=1 Tax=Salipaludibacillus sp. HK11 TaxID=3394320 RepID=UPI0039FB9464